MRLPAPLAQAKLRECNTLGPPKASQSPPSEPAAWQPKLQGLGQVFLAYRLAAGEVGESSGHPQDPSERPDAQSEVLGATGEDPFSG